MGNILREIRQRDFSLDGLAEAYPDLNLLKGVKQNPQYHAEGDVYRHTGLVCEEMRKLGQWQRLSEREQELLFLAGAFHDIGKPACTRLEDGKWTSPKHTIVGEKVFRAMAYRGQERFGLTFEEREQTARLIRYHGLPVWFWTKRRPEFDLLKAAESVPLEFLHLLSLADAMGRISREPEDLRGHIELFYDYGKELGVLKGPYPFANAYTRYQYFHRDSLWQGSTLYDDTEFDVWLMSGLPLAGKDTWIRDHGAGKPVISLDDIREEYNIAPGRNPLRWHLSPRNGPGSCCAKKSLLSGTPPISSRRPGRSCAVCFPLTGPGCASCIWKHLTGNCLGEMRSAAAIFRFRCWSG